MSARYGLGRSRIAPDIPHLHLISRLFHPSGFVALGTLDAVAGIGHQARQPGKSRRDSKSQYYTAKHKNNTIPRTGPIARLETCRRMRLKVQEGGHPALPCSPASPAPKCHRSGDRDGHASSPCDWYILCGTGSIGRMLPRLSWMALSLESIGGAGVGWTLGPGSCES